MKASFKETYMDLGISIKSSTGTGSSDKTRPITGNRDHKWDLVTSDGRLTFWGVYCRLLLEMQNARKWQDETCRRYGSFVCNRLSGAFMDDCPAFEDLFEEDVLLRWQRTLDGIDSEGTAQSCHLLLRVIMQMAYDKGYTRTLLVGMVNPYSDADIPADREEDIDSEFAPVLTPEQAEEICECDGKRRAKKLDNKTCISPEAEYIAYSYSESKVNEFGEYLGVEIAAETGNRTSEVVGYSYEDLVLIDVNWALRILKTSNQSSRETEIGGKTSNAYRYLPISTHLANQIREREKMIAAIEGIGKTGKLPIVCVGTNYKMRCTQREFNRAAKDALVHAKVSEDILRAAGESIRDNRQLSDENESSATAYLWRHQRITWAVVCGYSQAQIYDIAGHKIETPNVEKSDFSNPDRFEELVRLNRCRPLIQLLDGTPNCDIEFTGDLIDQKSFGEVRIRIPAGTSFQIAAQALEPNQEIILESSGSTKLNRIDFPAPTVNPAREISICNLLSNCVRHIQASSETALMSHAAVEDDDWSSVGDLCLTRSAEIAIANNETIQRENASHSGTENTGTPESPVSEASALPEKMQDTGADETSEDVIETACDNDSSIPVGRRAKPSVIPIKPQCDIFYLLDGNRIAPVAQEALVLGKIAQAGVRGISLGKKDRIVGVCTHDTQHEALLLSADRVAYRIPSGVRLNEYLSDPVREQQLVSLCHGGLIVPQTDDALDLVLVSHGGRIRTYLRPKSLQSPRRVGS